MNAPSPIAGFPPCSACGGEGRLLPLSSVTPHGAALHYWAWVCSNPDCGHNLRIAKDKIVIGPPIKRARE